MEAAQRIHSQRVCFHLRRNNTIQKNAIAKWLVAWDEVKLNPEPQRARKLTWFLKTTSLQGLTRFTDFFIKWEEAASDSPKVAKVQATIKMPVFP
ncbi:hypothetical protein SMI01S_17080 [Sphingobacterium mizutaii NBRC 14946 = DSM 11724]|uniref:4a-hydroxytetrahydrobiopterin dehydratase n=1 Tax=Sphingobacterium mizutaii NBRC 14946 = DSM 11724 TaxID=1220576 RepID=A0ABQ0W2B6_9SPHI|nr:hypothetical protein SMI01S_17080 [Sphingobacterium mizutaii NBRC 14946 = DSM 11724]